MADCKFLYLRAKNAGLPSRMLSGEITSFQGSEESRASAADTILWPKVSCAPCRRWRRDLAAAVSPAHGEEGLRESQREGSGISVRLTHLGEGWKVNGFRQLALPWGK